MSTEKERRGSQREGGGSLLKILKSPKYGKATHAKAEMIMGPKFNSFGKGMIKAGQTKQTEKFLEQAIEIIPNKLFWYSNKFPPVVKRVMAQDSQKENESDDDDEECAIRYVVLNVDSSLAYLGYNRDFGPLNMGQVHRYCEQVFAAMSEHRLNSKVKILHHCSTHYQKQANAVFLMCAYQVLCLGRTAEDSFAPFKGLSLIPFVDAGDANVTVQTFEVSVLDCLRGLQRGLDLGWYSFKSFDQTSYEKAYQLTEGDMNWIIQRRILAFSSPVSPCKAGIKAEGVRPQKFIERFQQLRIKHIVRLNDSLYDEEIFSKAGITIHDLEFPDGTCPDMDTVAQFISICDQARARSEAVAVHCRAGLGRTGTLIACYIINKHTAFQDARAVIGWLRIQRPGSVIGIQQQFLVDKFDTLRKLNADSIKSKHLVENVPTFTKAPTRLRRHQIYESSSSSDEEVTHQWKKPVKKAFEESKKGSTPVRKVSFASPATATENVLKPSLKINTIVSPELKMPCCFSPKQQNTIKAISDFKSPEVPESANPYLKYYQNQESAPKRGKLLSSYMNMLDKILAGEQQRCV